MGEILGGMLIIYTISKIAEAVILKRVYSNFSSMVIASSVLIFSVIATVRLVTGDNYRTFPIGMLISYFLAASILPVIRIGWKKWRS